MSENYKKSLALASDLFPDEEWILTEPNIWVAQSRFSQKEREPKKWIKELSQVRILTNRGSLAFFLPEIFIQDGKQELCAELHIWSYDELRAIIGT